MTLMIVVSGHSKKDIVKRLAAADLNTAVEEDLRTAPDGSTINHRWTSETFETIAAYHNAQMELVYAPR